MPIYATVMLVSWLLFLLIWIIGALGMKRDAMKPSGAFWFWRILVIILIIYAVHHERGAHYWDTLLFHANPIAGWIAAILVVLGLALAIWARFYLGRNWSPHPSYKEEHDLVTGGPYAYVRHPIYTGVLLALFGTIFTGYFYSPILFVVVGIMFLTRIPREELIMLGLFPNTYPPYQARTKKLIPFIW